MNLVTMERKVAGRRRCCTAAALHGAPRSCRCWPSSVRLGRAVLTARALRRLSSPVSRLSDSALCCRRRRVGCSTASSYWRLLRLTVGPDCSAHKSA